MRTLACPLIALLLLSGCDEPAPADPTPPPRVEAPIPAPTTPEQPTPDPVVAEPTTSPLPLETLVAPGLDLGPMTVCDTSKLAIHPIGFSKRGAFAYFIRTDEDAMLLWRLLIVDLVEDRRLAQVSLEGGEGKTPALADFVEARGEAIREALEKHGIVPSPGEELLPNSFEQEEDRYGLTVMVRPLDEAEAAALEDHPVPPVRATFRLHSRARGFKDIATVYHRKCCDFVGVLRSPHEPRIAALSLVGEHGFEGAVVCDLAVHGAHLTKGFEQGKGEQPTGEIQIVAEPPALPEAAVVAFAEGEEPWSGVGDPFGPRASTAGKLVSHSDDYDDEVFEIETAGGKRHSFFVDPAAGHRLRELLDEAEAHRGEPVTIVWQRVHYRPTGDPTMRSDARVALDLK
ncbi:MAG: hypothetical protein P1V51_16795 [Deltaproteobacteria bacterium]|nr:hypothetical protein [Deltaproteobacteria bacterium]